MQRAKAFLQVRSRYEKLRDKRKWERFLQHAERIYSDYRENLEEYFSANNDLVRRRLVRKIVLSSEEMNMPVRLCMCALLDIFELLNPKNRGTNGAEFLTLIRDGVLLDNSMEEFRIELAERMRSMIRELLKHIPVTEESVLRCVKMVVDSVLELPDDDLVMLSDPFPDWEPLFAGLDGKIQEGILSETACAELEKYVKELKTRHAVLTLELKEKGNKTERATDYVIAPLDEPPDSCLFYEEEIVVILTELALQEYIDWIAGEKNTQHKKHFEEPEDESRHIERMRLLGSHAEFWYVVLFQILDSYVPGAEDAVPDMARRILDTMIRHPTKLRKMSVPAEYDKFKGRLKRYVAPCLKGFHPDEEGYLIEERLEEDLEPRHYVDLVAEYISLSFYDDKQLGIRHDDQLKAVEKAWSDFFEPQLEKIATHFCLDMLGHEAEELKTLEDTSSEHEFQAYMQEYLESDTEEFDADLEQDVVSQVDFESEPLQQDWYYVPNLATPERRERIEFTSEDKADTLDTFFSKMKIKSVIKSTSIANALEYYLGLPDSIRQLMPKESLGEHTWDKLKRGKLRILARKENSDLIFHIFPRKEWKRDMFDI